MTDMYQWIDIVSEGMNQSSFKPGETVTINKDHGGGVGQFVGYSPERGVCTVNVKGSPQEYTPECLTAAIESGDIYKGNTEAQRYDEVDGDDHYLPTLPELQAGTLVKIENIYGAGNGEGYGVFVAYATDGQSAVCNVDSKGTSFPIAYITAAPEETLDKFDQSGTDGSLSPMSRGEENRLDIEIDEEPQMEDLEKWMKIVEEGPDTEVEEVEEACGDCDCGKYDCDICFPSDEKVDEDVAVLADNEIFDAVYELAEELDCDDDDDDDEELDETCGDDHDDDVEELDEKKADKDYDKDGKIEDEKDEHEGARGNAMADKEVDEAFTGGTQSAIQGSDMAENYVDALRANELDKAESYLRHVDMQSATFQKAFHKRKAQKEAFYARRHNDEEFEGKQDRLRELAGIPALERPGQEHAEHGPLTHSPLEEEDPEQEFDTGDSSAEFAAGDDEMVDIDDGGVTSPDDEFATVAPEMGPDMGTGAPEDVNELVHKISYMQDLGISMSDKYYDIEKLWSMDPRHVKAIHAKVTGEMAEDGGDWSVDDSAYMGDTVTDDDYYEPNDPQAPARAPEENPPKLDIQREAVKEALNESADADVLAILAALNEG